MELWIIVFIENLLLIENKPIPIIIFSWATRLDEVTAWLNKNVVDGNWPSYSSVTAVWCNQGTSAYLYYSISLWERQYITWSGGTKIMGNVTLWQLHDICLSCFAWHGRTGVCLFLHSHPFYQIDLKLAAEWKLKKRNFWHLDRLDCFLACSSAEKLSHTLTIIQSSLHLAI